MNNKKEKKKTWIIWIGLGLFVFGVLTTGMEIGETAIYCNATQIAQVDENGTWQCADLNTGIWNVYFNTSIYKIVDWDVTTSDYDTIEQDASIYDTDKYIFGGMFE